MQTSNKSRTVFFQTSSVISVSDVTVVEYAGLLRGVAEEVVVVKVDAGDVGQCTCETTLILYSSIDLWRLGECLWIYAVLCTIYNSLDVRGLM